MQLPDPKARKRDPHSTVGADRGGTVQSLESPMDAIGDPSARPRPESLCHLHDGAQATRGLRVRPASGPDV